MGFYDSKGYFRNFGDSFYDGKGYLRSWGSGFYDARGYFRNWGSGFYDTKGNWVNFGNAFYDYKNNICSSNEVTSNSRTGEEISIGIIGFILLIPVVLLGLILSSLIEWITSHFYIVYIVCCFIATISCFVVTKKKKHRKINFLLGFIGNFLCFLSFLYITLLYTVPNVKVNGFDFGGVFEFLLVSLLGIGGIAVIQFFNFYHEKAVLEFVSGTLYFVGVIHILKNNTNVIDSFANLAEIYGIEINIILKVLFGFSI